MPDTLTHRSETALRTLGDLLKEYRLADRDAETYETTAREALGLLSRVRPLLADSAAGAEVQAFLERQGVSA